MKSNHVSEHKTIPHCYPLYACSQSSTGCEP